MEVIEEKIFDNDKIESTYINPLESYDEISIDQYMKIYKNRITQDSEQLFVKEFLFPLFGNKKMKYVIPSISFFGFFWTFTAHRFWNNI